mmetsp:Transcript_49990/g.99285  ORF Transcript_49990/g.99285 Transcript_49990/m.99285 type:complete len:203 (-) Transcript_49990:1357-1965(-)
MEERFALVVSVRPPGSNGHVIVDHGLFLDVAVRVHGDRQLAPTVLQAKEGGADSPTTLHGWIECIHDGITWFWSSWTDRPCTRPFDQFVDRQRTTICEHKHSRPVQCQYLFGEAQLQTGQRSVNAVLPLVLYRFVIAKRKHDDVGACSNVQCFLNPVCFLTVDFHALRGNSAATSICSCNPFCNGTNAVVVSTKALLICRVV